MITSAASFHAEARADAPLRAPSPWAPSYFCAGPTTTVIADDEGEVVHGTPRDAGSWLAALERRLGAEGGLVVGAVPFADDAPVRLFRPARVRVLDAWQVPAMARARRRASAPDVLPDDPAFRAAVRDATSAIARGELKKVVLARARELPWSGRLDLWQLLSVLRARQPHGFTYSLALGGREARTLVGASPELLLSRRGGRLVSVPLAGSAPRGASPAEDRERAARLLRSPKDRHEHQLVVDHILECLRPVSRDLTFEREPELCPTPTMWHLSTRIEGQLRDSGMSSLRLALALHPTPAVCGMPTRDARALIRRVEDFDRGYFTGTLGHMNGDGDGDWVVTIRCAELGPSHLRVFAGAGIVESSVPEQELAETDHKMNTILSALGDDARA